VLSRLPEAYAQALRLRDAGLSDAAIAHQLGVPAEAIAMLMRLAEAKLAHLMAGDEPEKEEADLIPPPASPPEGTV
jgi:DNA-directed RNA polymerase specialized sigma24 family protein